MRARLRFSARFILVLLGTIHLGAVGTYLALAHDTSTDMEGPIEIVGTVYCVADDCTECCYLPIVRMYLCEGPAYPYLLSSDVIDLYSVCGGTWLLTGYLSLCGFPPEFYFTVTDTSTVSCSTSVSPSTWGRVKTIVAP